MIKRIIPFLAVAVFASIIYVSFEWAVGAIIHDRKVVMVPEVTAKSVSDALNLLEPTHLGLAKEGEQFDKRYPAGTIVRQNPPSGMMVREGRIIRITLSQGGETLFAPEMIGQPLRNAQTTLQNVGLSVGEIEHRPSLRFEKDQVMASDPPSGAVVAKNTLVNIVLSDGPPAADVVLAPDFVGRGLDAAKSWAASHQVSVSVREETDISKPQGQIIMQSPTTDSPIRAGDTLTVVSNSGSVNPQGPHVHYEVPQGSSDVDIKVILVDESGEREVFRQAQSPGSKVDFNVQPRGHARARIFKNGIVAEEQVLQ